MARKKATTRGGQSGPIVAIDRAAALQAEAFNKHSPRGSQVRYWTGAIEGEGKIGITRSDAGVLGGHTAVVMICGVVGCVALSHVRPTGPADFEASPDEDDE